MNKLILIIPSENLAIQQFELEYAKISQNPSQANLQQFNEMLLFFIKFKLYQETTPPTSIYLNFWFI